MYNTDLYFKYNFWVWTSFSKYKNGECCSFRILAFSTLVFQHVSFLETLAIHKCPFWKVRSLRFRKLTTKFWLEFVRGIPLLRRSFYWFSLHWEFSYYLCFGLCVSYFIFICFFWSSYQRPAIPNNGRDVEVRHHLRAFCSPHLDMFPQSKHQQVLSFGRSSPRRQFCLPPICAVSADVGLPIVYGD